MTEIINKKYLTQAASTVFEQPTDPVVGLHKENPTSKWYFKSIGGGRYYIQNIETDLYATVASETEGARVFCHVEPYTWQPIRVDDGWYRIATDDATLVWRLTGSEDRAPVQLHKSAAAGEDAVWGIGANALVG